MQGHFFRNYHVHKRQALVAPVVAAVPWRPAWELADVGTVLMEAGVLVAVLRRRFMVGALAFMTSLHVAIFATMNIDFATNVVGYGPLLRWARPSTAGRVHGWRAPPRAWRPWRRATCC